MSDSEQLWTEADIWLLDGRQPETYIRKTQL